MAIPGSWENSLTTKRASYLDILHFSSLLKLNFHFVLIDFFLPVASQTLLCPISRDIQTHSFWPLSNTQHSLYVKRLCIELDLCYYYSCVANYMPRWNRIPPLVWQRCVFSSVLILAFMFVHLRPKRFYQYSLSYYKYQDKPHHVLEFP